MKVYTTLNIGEFHTNHCEDFWVVEPIGSNEKLIAVIDGCTMGTESVFSSILSAKLLRKIAKKYYYQNFFEHQITDLKEILKQIVNDLFTELKQTKKLLDLEINEMLSTLIIGVIDTGSKDAELLTIGDGLIYCDGSLTEYEQNNKPDYLAYHLDEKYNLWFDKQEQKLSLKKFNDLSICTDGIFTFRNLKDSNKQMNESEIIEYLLKDNSGADFDNMLDRKIRFLDKNLGHKVTDDLAIVRIIMNL